jgi:carbon monoxide dehydrogenase subunit G
MRVVETVRIERSAQDVWSVIGDLDQHTKWRPAVREFRQVSDGPLGVGSRIREVLSWRGREIVIDDVVTLFEPGRRLGLRGGWKAADFEVDFRLETVTEGTQVTMDWPLYPKSFLLKIAAPFMAGAMRRATKEELELLKAYVERGPEAATRE